MNVASKWLSAIAAASGLALLPAHAAWPERPIHLLVGFPPGSQPDLVGRLVGQELSAGLGRPIVVENVTGASGDIAAERLAKAAPDGYVIGLLSQTHLVVNPALHAVPYDPVKDFAPISQLVRSPNLLVVSPSLGARTVPELVALAKSRPGELTFASSGTGSGTHIAAELFKSATAVDIRHIPYKGVVAAVPDVMAGRVSMMFSPIPVVAPLVREGKLRALAVTSLARSAAAPGVPTVAEAGYAGFEATNWYGLAAPAGTPAAIIRRLHGATIAALRSTALRDRLAAQGLDVIGNAPDEFAAALAREQPAARKWIESSGLGALQ